MKLLAFNWPNLAVLPYFAAIRVFSTYVGVVSTPWTIGWIILWLIFSPLAAWSGVFIMGGAIRLATACFIALIAATPFRPDAIEMCATLAVAFVLGVLYPLWITIAVFVVIVAAIWVWYHGGLVL